jgi:uncharacterized protein (DUF4415 family)
MKEKHMKNRTRNLDKELATLARMKDEEIDTSDMPEVKDWSRAVVGRFYRPIKEPVTLRLDADVVAWFKEQGPGYQTRINDVLRKVVRGRTHASNACGDHTAATLAECASLRFPSLERHGQLERYSRFAGLVEERRCFFAKAS